MLAQAVTALIVSLGLVAIPAAASPGQVDYLDLAARMIESNVARGQGLSPTNQSSTYIGQAVFQQALRAAINTTKNAKQKTAWEGYLDQSTTSLIGLLSDATHDAELPLDRFSAGTSLTLRSETSDYSKQQRAINALRQSVLLQSRNANGGFWYYNLLSNIQSYRNLSYLDGMYSYPAFAALSMASVPQPSGGYVQDALLQLDVLYEHCVQPSGLLVHGYDALRQAGHSWANPVTGASPVVWGRALAWYTVGLVTMFQQELPLEDRVKLKSLFQKVAGPQIQAYEDSIRKTGEPGVWQVVDRPGDQQNFIEASASFLTSFALLAGARMGLLNQTLQECAIRAGIDIYNHASKQFLIKATNSTLSINGTSSVASLGSGGNISYGVNASPSMLYDRYVLTISQYYVTRPTELNSLFGTSSFILASLEMSRLDC